VPTITATADNAKSQVRLDLDFSDVCAPYVLVNRVDPLTGQTTQVRGHGGSVTVGSTAYAPLYAGYKTVLYDTELPLDNAFYYTATAPAGVLNVNPTFSGGYVDPWYVTDPAINLKITKASSGQNFLSFSTAGATPNPTIRAEDIPATPGVALTVTATVSTSGSNGVTVGFVYRDSSGTILATMQAAATVFASTTLTASGVAPANTVTAQLFVQMNGTPGSGVTCNVASITLTPFQANTATSGGVMVPSLGSCQFKDPLIPGNNVRVDFAWDPNPLCTPTEGIFWQSLDQEQYAANSAVFNVNNQDVAQVVSKRRSAPSSTLTLVSRTFPDRDRLIALLAPGSPLLFQAPDEYGLPDRYISVGANSISRVLPDHRIPIRVHSMPHTVCAAPGGPMQGTVGARWQDLCNRYATWGAVNSAGLTWQQLLDGLAG
jgi:hypothetical protein